jgi:hypothetical protein
MDIVRLYALVVALADRLRALDGDVPSSRGRRA